VRPEEAQSAFIVGTHLAGQGDFGSARDALLGCIAAGDPEWSPRAAGMLGEMLWDRGDPDGAEAASSGGTGAGENGA
jgi:hypothetical protein